MAGILVSCGLLWRQLKACSPSVSANARFSLCFGLLKYYRVRIKAGETVQKENPRGYEMLFFVVSLQRQDSGISVPRMNQIQQAGNSSHDQPAWSSVT